MGFIGTPVTTPATVPTAQEMVDAIDAMIFGALEAGGVQDFAIAGQRISTFDGDDLLSWRKYYQSRVSVAASPGGGLSYAGGNRRR